MTMTATTRQRTEDLLQGLDQLAIHAALAQLTSRHLSRASGVSEGVMFRLFNGMDPILEQWIDSRGQRLMTLISGAPANKAGFLQMLQSLVDAPALLGLWFAELKASPAVLEQLQTLRRRAEQELAASLRVLAMERGDQQAYVDHLLVSLRRSWDPRVTDEQERSARRQRLLTLPWETPDMTPSDLLPAPALLQRLAINDSGFVFDPVSGRSFTVNPSGLALLQAMMRETAPPAIIDALQQDWSLDPVQAERDLLEFAAELRKAFQG